MNKIKKIILKWLGIPENLKYQLDKLDTWSKENERRRHLLHKNLEGWAKHIVSTKNKVSELEKKEHALSRHFNIKYDVYFTTENCTCKKIHHYNIKINPPKEVDKTDKVAS